MAALFVSAALCFYPLSFSCCTVSLQDCFVQLIREGKKQKVDSTLIFVGLLILALLQACLSPSIAVSPHLLKLAKQKGTKSGIAPSPVMDYDSSFLWLVCDQPVEQKNCSTAVEKYHFQLSQEVTFL